ncbi:Uu.00g125260.m01.CDS01 [Anthostomella pinea]|uniref:Uu.00g125260.m01.CDS01 n=1 Tax=Anthostomella pinea TaxID=933095 RepID=A0AAI8YHT7_9PEZI|nr:Uu.00g125260.m01.CDS01 [Anthostomella pinea]
MKNDKPNLESDFYKQHNPNSEYQKKQDKTRVFRCAVCDKEIASFNGYSGHQRSKHGFRGAESPLWADELLS